MLLQFSTAVPFRHSKCGSVGGVVPGFVASISVTSAGRIIEPSTFKGSPAKEDPTVPVIVNTISEPFVILRSAI
ncbi:hypothetical protein D3C86_1462260 [compost metagenome]